MPDGVHARPCSGPEPHQDNEVESLVKVEDRIGPEVRRFYRRAITTLQEAEVPLLLGGAFAFEFYTGVARYTKDIDIFIRARDAERALDIFSRAGYTTEVTAPHWLLKACSGDVFVDVIFGEANGVIEVDDEWFEKAQKYSIFGLELSVCPVEETIRSKSFVMDRDRFDGANVAHLLRACAEKIDWPRLVRRFGRYWHILLSHLLLFTFIYPSESGRIPSAVVQDLLNRLQQELESPPSKDRICRGTLLSMSQFRPDIMHWGYRDARELKETL